MSAAPEHERHAAGVAARHVREAVVERREEPARRVMLALQDQHRERGRERERHDARDHHGDGDGDRELAVELAREAAQERDRNEHRRQHQHDRDHRARDLGHRLDGGAPRVQLVLAHVPLDVLQHDDRVVDDDADRQHHAEQRQGVDRVAVQVQAGERAGQRHRHRDHRNDRRAPALQEQVHDEEDQQHRLAQRLQHLADRHLDEARRVVRRRVLEALGEARRQLGHRRVDRLRHRERVGARRQEDADERRRLAVEAAHELVILRAQLDPRDVGQAHVRAVRIGADNDLLEFLGVGEPALGGDRVDEVLVVEVRRLAHLARGELRVLLVDGSDHVGRREAKLRHPVGLQPDAHRIVVRAEDLDVHRARQPLQLVEHVQRDVVRRVEVVVAAVRRVERQHLKERRRAALDVDTLPPHFLRQPRLHLLDAVVDVDRGVVDVGADLERHLDLHDPLRRRVRAHVEHVGNAVDGVLDRRRDGLLQHFGGRAGIHGADGHDGRRDFRILGDRQVAHRGQAREHEERRDDDREDRSVDEKAGKHEWALLRLFLLCVGRRGGGLRRGGVRGRGRGRRGSGRGGRRGAECCAGRAGRYL